MALKKITSMVDFAKAIEQVAKASGESFYQVDCKMKKISDDAPMEISFICYINGFTAHISAETPEKAVLLAKQFFGLSEETPIRDITI